MSSTPTDSTMSSTPTDSTMSSTPTGSYPTYPWTSPSPPVEGGDGCYNPVSMVYDIPVGTEASSECESYICTVEGWTLLDYSGSCCMLNEKSFPDGTELTMITDGPNKIVCSCFMSNCIWMEMDNNP